MKSMQTAQKSEITDKVNEHTKILGIPAFSIRSISSVFGDYCKFIVCACVFQCIRYINFLAMNLSDYFLNAFNSKSVCVVFWFSLRSANHLKHEAFKRHSILPKQKQRLNKHLLPEKILTGKRQYTIKTILTQIIIYRCFYFFLFSGSLFSFVQSSIVF